jgi:hypothetical protein
MKKKLYSLNFPSQTTENSAGLRSDVNDQSPFFFLENHHRMIIINNEKDFIELMKCLTCYVLGRSPKNSFLASTVSPSKLLIGKSPDVLGTIGD